MVCGPDYSIYLCSSRCPGRWHDSRVLKESTLWTAFEGNAQRPFPGALILGESACTCNSWLIPPFRGDVQGARLRFNKAQRKTRSTIERANVVIKNRFYILQTGIRVRSITRATELIQCAAILHTTFAYYLTMMEMIFWRTKICTLKTMSLQNMGRGKRAGDGSYCSIFCESE